MNPKPLLAFLLPMAACVAGLSSAPYEPRWASLDRRPMPAWFADAKFGIFIHWGVYSVPAWAPVGEYAEWYWEGIRSSDPKKAAWRSQHEATCGAGFDYRDFAPQFRAGLFQPEQWADLFMRSGAKYVVLTSKHHDGFALWPSAEASRTWGRPWNAVETGPRRDLVGDLAAATRARGLTFGLYFSFYEWFNPLWLSDKRRFVDEHMIPQFKDVVTRYRPSLIFNDGEWDLPSAGWRSEELLAWLFNESPVRAEVVVNDRWGRETRHKHGGYWTTEYAAGLPDAAHAWEENRGMGHSYGLNRAERAGDYKTARELILLLADTVSRGGNLLLDIGPAADGTIPPLMEERLREIGDWLRVNSEAIHGTRPAARSCQWTEGRRPDQAYGDYKVRYELLAQVGQQPREGLAVKQVFFTQKPGALYAITAGWPGRTLTLHGVNLPAGAGVTMLGVSGELGVERAGDRLVITLPDIGPDEAPCRHAYVLKLPGATVQP
ncbi:MAG: alpha-L-fucosidase [Verrucomicrobiota bacterium]